MNDNEHIVLPAPYLWYERTTFAEPYRTALHCHPAWQLTVSLKEETFFDRNGRRLILSPGDWILFPPELLHESGSTAKNSAVIQLFFRNFPAEILPEIAKLLNFRRGRTFHGRISLQYVQKAAKTFHAPGKYVQSRLNLLTADLILTALQSAEFENTPANPLRPDLLRAVEFMERHCHEPVGVPDFAAAAGLSVSRFNDVFRQLTGRSPMDFFNEQRLGLAQTLLLQGFPVEECARRCGFSSAGYFCRKFKAYASQTPGEFRKQPFAANK